MITGRPAAARLRRMRWLLTLLYAAVSAVSLATLVVIAASIDARSGSRQLDSEIKGRAEALSRAIWMDKGALHLEPLSEDELATASDVTAVLQRIGSADAQARWLRPKRDGALPGAGRLDDLWAATVRQQEPVLATIRGPDGRRLRWASAPVWDADEIGAVVLVAADPAPQERSHRELVFWLVAGGTVLMLASIAAGHLLSGKSLRPAMRTLEQQEQFLAEAAHELRTPLATLRLAVEPSGMPDAVRLVDHLDRLVTGLLSRARIDSGTRPLELTPLRLDLLVEQVVEEWPARAARVSVRTEPTVVLGDPDLLTQAIRNLLENALRHGAPPGEPAEVEVSVADGRVAVRDHGPGIDPADREAIFGDRVTGGRGGIGVGLPIVRWVAELHGGRASVAESPGRGARVELELPRFIVR